MRTDDKTILKGLVGSQAYGTATADSDTDFMTVVIPGDDYIFGMKQWGNSGTKEETYTDPQIGFVENKMFEFRKCVKMCAGFNPNIIPLLWLDLQHYTVMTAEGQMLVANRELFSSKIAYNTLSGYAYSQLKKMGGCPEAEEEDREYKTGLQKAIAWCEAVMKQQRSFRNDRIMATDSQSLVDGTPNGYDRGYLKAITDICTHAKEESKKIKEGPATGRMGAKRKALREKFGYDVKYAFHVIRLLKMANEFFESNGKVMNVNRAGIDAEWLFAIRNGSMTIKEVTDLAAELNESAKVACDRADMPDTPDNAAINDLCKRIMYVNLVDSKDTELKDIITDFKQDRLTFNLEVQKQLGNLLR